MRDDKQTPQDPQDDQNTNGPTDFHDLDDDSKHQAAKSPDVTNEEDVLLGDQPESGADYDIDEALKAVGRTGDEDGIRPLGDQSEEEDI